MWQARASAAAYRDAREETLLSLQTLHETRTGICHSAEARKFLAVITAGNI
jgi:hypothetical protein